jgi:hypothetical protein
MTKFPTQTFTTWSMVLVYLLVTGAGWAGMPCCGVNWGCGLDQAVCSGCNHGLEATTNGNQCYLASRLNDDSINCSCNCFSHSIQGINTFFKFTSVMRVSDDTDMSAHIAPRLTTLSQIDLPRDRSAALGPNEFNSGLAYLGTVILTC